MLQKPFQITVASSKNPIDWKRPLANDFPSSNLTRLLSHHIQTKILDPSRLPSILLLIRTNMFPNNSLGPGRVPPTPSEALTIKTKCATAIIAAIPPVVVKQVFAGAGEEENKKTKNEKENKEPDQQAEQAPKTHILENLKPYSKPSGKEGKALNSLPQSQFLTQEFAQ
ncbi:unnamed protein product [Aureobasidium pullulans]|nr:unnamed protein product [Aureobasidium pullulans]